MPANYLRYYKMGDGPYYTLLRPYFLPHLEIPKTIRRVIQGGGALLTNSATPRVSVGAVAKHALRPGDVIDHGSGSFDVRGVAVRMHDQPDHLPIGLLHNAVLRHAVEPEQMLTFADVDLPDTLALEAWRTIAKAPHCVSHGITDKSLFLSTIAILTETGKVISHLPSFASAGGTTPIYFLFFTP